MDYLNPLDLILRPILGSAGRWSAEAMPGGASTRKFFRLSLTPHQLEHDAHYTSAVAFFVPDANKSDEIDKTDGRRLEWPFIEVHRLLAQHGVNVPKILADGSEHGWLVVEDLGDDTLAQYLAKKPHTKEQCYRIAVQDLAKAQLALAQLPEHSVVKRRAFDEDLLEWEIHHFREWALEARGINLSNEDRSIFDGIAKRLAHRIASWPRGFVHRDYQSRNLMVLEHNGAPQLHWIDFQDALLGPRVYDLVALLNDSYQTFDRPFVENRLDDFAAAAGYSPAQRQELGLEFDLVTVQRKLKDAGRFIFIDRQKNNPSFLQFVEPTIEKVLRSLERLQHDQDMRSLLVLLNKVLEKSQ